MAWQATSSAEERADRKRCRISHDSDTGPRDTKQCYLMDENIELVKIEMPNPLGAGGHQQLQADFGASITVVFPREEYIGTYLHHDRTKTSFLLRGCENTGQRFHSTVLKVKL